MELNPERQFRTLLLCVLLAALVFALDLFIPLGVAGGVPYVAVVLLAVRLKGANYTVFFAVLCTMLTLFGLWLSPPGGEIWKVLANRGLAGFAIWVTAILSLRQKRTQRALQESEARAQTILDTSIDAIITFDEQGYIGSFNPAAERAFGFLVKEVKGCQIELLLASPYRKWKESLLHTAQAGAGANLEVIGQRKDGSTFPMELSLSRMEVNGRAMYTAIVRDITERRWMEQKVFSTSDQERRQIGHDLQEELGQMLTGIGLINQTLARKLQAEEQPYATEVMQITDLIREADRYAKGLAQGLSPVALDEVGLSLALRRLALDTENRFGVPCTFEEEGVVLVRNNMVAAHLYKIAQEAIKHAIQQRGATQVRVQLSSGDALACLRVQDNGQVHSGGAEENRHTLDLDIISYRAHLIGAILDFSRKLPGGVALTCTVPHDTYEIEPVQQTSVYPSPAMLSLFPPSFGDGQSSIAGSP